MRSLSLTLVLALLSYSCSSQQERFSSEDELPKSEASHFLGNTTDFEKALSRADTSRGLKSLLVLKNDTLIFEKYFDGHSSRKNYHVRSVTKSFISLLTGIALDQGLITNLDESIAPYLSEYTPRKNRKKLQGITIKHLLTMTTGYEWNEGSANGYIDWDRSEDRIDYVLKRDLAETPGKRFNYNSGTAHLMSVVLEKKIGQPLMTFAKKNLLDPLGIRMDDVNYQSDRRDFVNGGAGLQLRARDMAKIGIMVANNGVYNEKRVVSENWIKQSFEPYASFPGQATVGEETVYTSGYGHLWWLLNIAGNEGALAWGWGGQFILVVPELDVIIITQNDWFVMDDINRRQIRSTFRVMAGILNSLEPDN